MLKAPWYSLHVNSSELYTSGLNTQVAILVCCAYKIKVIKLKLHNPYFCTLLTDFLSSDVPATMHLYTENSKKHFSNVSSLGHPWKTALIITLSLTNQHF